MSQFTRGILGVIAVLLTCGAVQVALGQDFAVIRQETLQDPPRDTAGTPDASINRAAKADRAVVAMASAAPTRTISLRLDGLSNTSILLRVPVTKEARSSASPVAKSGNRKMMLACEPVVSVLTEIAKQLQPGRCVT